MARDCNQNYHLRALVVALYAIRLLALRFLKINEEEFWRLSFFIGTLIFSKTNTVNDTFQP